MSKLQVIVFLSPSAVLSRIIPLSVNCASIPLLVVGEVSFSSVSWFVYLFELNNIRTKKV